MRIIRICRAKHPDLDGKGAAIVGGRWNSLGTQVVYTSSCGALAVLEYRVHALEDPADLLIITLEVDDTPAIERSAQMPDVPAARRFGDFWIKSQRSLVLAVPSVVVPHQLNYLLNPAHPAFAHSIKEVERSRFVLDVRLFEIAPPSVHS